MTYSKRTVVQSVIAALIVIAFAVFAVMAPTRHEMGERFMMLAALATVANFLVMLRRKKQEADEGHSSDS